MSRYKQQRQRFLSHIQEDNLEDIFTRLKSKLDVLQQVIDIFKDSKDPVIQQQIQTAKKEVSDDIRTLAMKGANMMDIYAKFGGILYKSEILQGQDFLDQLRKKQQQSQVVDLVNEDMELYRRNEINNAEFNRRYIEKYHNRNPGTLQAEYQQQQSDESINLGDISRIRRERDHNMSEPDEDLQNIFSQLIQQNRPRQNRPRSQNQREQQMSSPVVSQRREVPAFLRRINQDQQMVSPPVRPLQEESKGQQIRIEEASPGQMKEETKVQQIRFEKISPSMSAHIQEQQHQVPKSLMERIQERSPNIFKLEENKERQHESPKFSSPQLTAQQNRDFGYELDQIQSLVNQYQRQTLSQQNVEILNQVIDISQVLLNQPNSPITLEQVNQYFRDVFNDIQSVDNIKIKKDKLDSTLNYQFSHLNSLLSRGETSDDQLGILKSFISDLYNQLSAIATNPKFIDIESEQIVQGNQNDYYDQLAQDLNAKIRNIAMNESAEQYKDNAQLLRNLRYTQMNGNFVLGGIQEAIEQEAINYLSDVLNGIVNVQDQQIQPLIYEANQQFLQGLQNALDEYMQRNMQIPQSNQPPVLFKHEEEKKQQKRGRSRTPKKKSNPQQSSVTPTRNLTPNSRKIATDANTLKRDTINNFILQKQYDSAINLLKDGLNNYMQATNAQTKANYDKTQGYVDPPQAKKIMLQLAQDSNRQDLINQLNSMDPKKSGKGVKMLLELL